MSSYNFVGLTNRQTFSFLVQKTFLCLFSIILIFGTIAVAQQKNIGKLRKQAETAMKRGEFEQAEKL